MHFELSEKAGGPGGLCCYGISLKISIMWVFSLLSHSFVLSISSYFLFLQLRGSSNLWLTKQQLKEASLKSIDGLGGILFGNRIERKNQ